MSSLDYALEHLSCSPIEIDMLAQINTMVAGTSVQQSYMHIAPVKGVRKTCMLSYYTSFECFMEVEMTSSKEGVFTFTPIEGYDDTRIHSKAVTVESTTLEEIYYKYIMSNQYPLNNGYHK
jgi:hypothetical protein